MEHAPEWFAQHEEADRKHFEERPTIVQMEDILDRKIDEALTRFFNKKGGLLYAWLLKAGVGAGAMTAILVLIQTLRNILGK